MNLARALEMIPDEITVTPHCWFPANYTKGETRRKPERWPDGMLNDCVVIMAISEISKKRVTWGRLTRWANQTYGMGLIYQTVQRAVTAGRTGNPKRRSDALPHEIALECAQLAIIQGAHGCKTPWMVVSDRLWKVHHRTMSNQQIAGITREWMKGHLTGRWS